MQRRKRLQLFDDGFGDRERCARGADEHLRCTRAGTVSEKVEKAGRRIKGERTHEDAVRHALGRRNWRDMRRLEHRELERAQEEVVQLSAQTCGRVAEKRIRLAERRSAQAAQTQRRGTHALPPPSLP